MQGLLKYTFQIDGAPKQQIFCIYEQNHRIKPLSFGICCYKEWQMFFDYTYKLTLICHPVIIT